MYGVRINNNKKKEIYIEKKSNTHNIIHTHIIQNRAAQVNSSYERAHDFPWHIIINYL